MYCLIQWSTGVPTSPTPSTGITGAPKLFYLDSGVELGSSYFPSKHFSELSPKPLKEDFKQRDGGQGILSILAHTELHRAIYAPAKVK